MVPVHGYPRAVEPTPSAATARYNGHASCFQAAAAACADREPPADRADAAKAAAVANCIWGTATAAATCIWCAAATSTTCFGRAAATSTTCCWCRASATASTTRIWGTASAATTCHCCANCISCGRSYCSRCCGSINRSYRCSQRTQRDSLVTTYVYSCCVRRCKCS